MKIMDFFRDKAPVILLNAAGLLVLSIFLLMLRTPSGAVALIVTAWAVVLAFWLGIEYARRKKYFAEAFQLLEDLDKKYLIGEVIEPSERLEDRLYREILRRSNKSVIEKIHEMEGERREYQEYIENWIHEVKTPITAIQLICENHREEYTARIGCELSEIENQVEMALYYARMERAYQDYLIHPVNLREIVLAAIRSEKQHLIQCGMQIELAMEDTLVATDEKWVQFLIKQIFSNCMKYRRENGGLIKISLEPGEQKKSLLIRDNGCGIAPEDLGRIFDKGFTGHNGRNQNTKATGMGLYICARLCEKLGIGISCQSKQGEYTCIILTFPDSDHNTPGGLQSRILTKQNSYKNERLL